MSTRIIKELVDDIDGGDAEETLNFAVNGVTYDIDLSPGNLTKFHEFMRPYIQNGRRVGGRQTKRGAAVTPTAPATAVRGDSYARLSKDQNKAIREWAEKNGHEIPPRGRLPKHILAAFDAAHTAK